MLIQDLVKGTELLIMSNKHCTVFTVYVKLIFKCVYLTTSFVTTQPHGVRTAPGVKQQRLQVVRDKIAARAELLSRPQRFATSQPLSRREMEIEQALFQGKDRLGFLTALYHRGLKFPLCSNINNRGYYLHCWWRFK